MNNDLVVGFVGMSHLGITTSIGAAEKGWNVVCFDPRTHVIDDLKHGRIAIEEPGLQGAIDRNCHNVSFVSEPKVLVKCDLVYIVLDVPTDANGNSDLKSIYALIDIVEPHLNNTAIVVNMCQVPPGFTRSFNYPNSQLYYQVETLIYGQALKRTLEPERIIVGCAKSGQQLDNRLARYLDSYDCPVFSMCYENAELTKLSINMCLVASLSVANMMSELCEKLNANWDEIVPALKSDRRIGQYAYLKPGLGISGGNLERDLATVLRLAESVGNNADVIRSLISDSAYRKDWILRILRKTILNNSRMFDAAVLGLAYKENTASITNSASIALLATLVESEQCNNVTVYDPLVKIEDTPITNVHVATTALAACLGAEVLLVMTPWPEFGDLDLTKLADTMKGKLVIDPYGLFSPHKCAEVGLRHFSLGRPSTESEKQFGSQ